jgi:hypothetical protein
MAVYVFVHPAYADSTCLPMTHFQWDALKQCGAVVCYGAKDLWNAISLRWEPTEEDVLLCYGRVDECMDAFALFNPKNRWHWVVDESNSTTLPYEKACKYMHEKGFTNMVVTDPNERYLGYLREHHDFDVVVYPQTVPAIRERKEKVADVLVSGQLSESFYDQVTSAR